MLRWMFALSLLVGLLAGAFFSVTGGQAAAGEPVRLLLPAGAREVTVEKAAAPFPAWMHRQYLAPGPVFSGTVRSSHLHFVFWDPGTYRLVFRDGAGSALPGREIQVGLSSGTLARSLGLAAGLVLLGLMVGHTSVRLPRPGAAVAAWVLVLMLGAGAAVPAPAAAETAGSAGLVTPAGFSARHLATVQAEAGGDQARVELVHPEDGPLISAVLAAADGRTAFQYAFPEGEAYRLKVNDREFPLHVLPVQPARAELWRGYLSALLFFIAGGLAGLYLGRRQEGMTARVHAG